MSTQRVTLNLSMPPAYRERFERLREDLGLHSASETLRWLLDRAAPQDMSRDTNRGGVNRTPTNSGL